MRSRQYLPGGIGTCDFVISGGNRIRLDHVACVRLWVFYVETGTVDVVERLHHFETERVYPLGDIRPKSRVIQLLSISQASSKLTNKYQKSRTYHNQKPVIIQEF